MLINIIRYLRGYVVIRVCGYSPERFLNLCSGNHILIWDIVNRNTCYEMKMSIRGFRKIRPFVRKTKTKIMIVEKHGLPFFIFRSRKRKAFFAGMVLCAGLLYGMSLFIWDIQIEGCVQYTDDLLMDFLADNGIVHGMRKSQVNGEDIQFLLRNGYPKITWASVSIDGTRLVVRIKENTVTGDEDIRKEEEEAPKDLLSPASGTIRSMIVRQGTPLKEVGDTVEEGEVLVRGRLEILNDSKEVAKYEYCPSDADIQVEYVLPYETKMDMAYDRREYSGRVKRAFFLKILSGRLSFSQNPKDFAVYDTVTAQHQIRLLDNFYIPVYFGEIRYREYEMVPDVYSEEEMERLLRERMNLDFEDLEKKGVQILENNVKIQIDESRGTASGTLLVQEKAKDTAPTEILSDPIPPEEEEND